MSPPYWRAHARIRVDRKQATIRVDRKQAKNGGKRAKTKCTTFFLGKVDILEIKKNNRKYKRPPAKKTG